jgi:hypothetical protein
MIPRIKLAAVLATRPTAFPDLGVAPGWMISKPGKLGGRLVEEILRQG